MSESEPIQPAESADFGEDELAAAESGPRASSAPTADPTPQPGETARTPGPRIKMADLRRSRGSRVVEATASVSRMFGGASVTVQPPARVAEVPDAEPAAVEPVVSQTVIAPQRSIRDRLASGIRAVKPVLAGLTARLEILTRLSEALRTRWPRVYRALGVIGAVMAVQGVIIVFLAVLGKI